MQNPFAYSDDNKRYHTLHYNLRHRYGGRVFKVPLNAGFICPNMDGTKGVGGWHLLLQPRERGFCR